MLLEPSELVNTLKGFSPLFYITDCKFSVMLTILIPCFIEFRAWHTLRGFISPSPHPSLPPTRNSCLHTVYILLTLFTEASTKKKAKRKPVYTEAVKQLLINQASPILTLHLKRFHQVGYSLRKIAKHVDFPLVLNLAPFCHKSCKVSRAAGEIYNR